MLTCDAENTGSRKIIERNSGVFESELYDDCGKAVLRYWIEVP